MIEVYGDLWEFPADMRVITTNGSTRKDGKAVMGRGCAYQATRKYPDIQAKLGWALITGNHVYLMEHGLVSFPVKDKWFEKADIGLIKQSALELVALANQTDWQIVVMPKPGCGNGGLKWEEVKPIIESILDNRFFVIDYAKS